MAEGPGRERWARIAAWFLAVCYCLGAPVTAAAELQRHVLSQRFDLPPWVVYATCSLQLLCAVGVLARRFATCGALGLTATTIGAIGAHVRIGSPRTAVPALLFTALQLWLAWVRRPSRRDAA